MLFLKLSFFDQALKNSILLINNFSEIVLDEIRKDKCGQKKRVRERESKKLRARVGERYTLAMIGLKAGLRLMMSAMMAR